MLVVAIAMAVSKHRKLLFQISQQLSSEDLAGLVYLAADIVPKSMSEKIVRGTDLFTQLESRAVLRPGEYSFMNECLEAIGRKDLVVLTTQLTVGTNTIPKLPTSFQTPNQLLLAKQSIFKAKHNRCILEIKRMSAKLIDGAQKDFDYYVCGLISITLVRENGPLLSTAHMDPDVVVATLNEISQFLQILPTGLERLCHRSAPQHVLPIMQQCQAHYSCFEDAVAKLEWKPAMQRCNMRKVAKLEQRFWREVQNVNHLFHDAITELVQNEIITESSKKMEHTVHSLQSVASAGHCFLLINTWLDTLLSQVDSMVQEAALSKHAATLMHLLHENREGIRRHYTLLSNILGKELVDRVMAAVSCHHSTASEDIEATHLPDSAAISLVEYAAIPMYTALLVLGSCIVEASYNPCFKVDMQTLLRAQLSKRRRKLLQEYTGFRQILSHSMQMEFEKFKEKAIQQILGQICGEKTAIRESMTQLLRYSEELDQLNYELVSL